MASEMSSSSSSASFLKVAAVSYEGSLFGWDIQADNDKKASGLDATMSFGFHCSAGSLKAIAVSSSGKYMVCGGMDERVHVFNVAEKRAIGEISGHAGAVSTLAFIGDTHLLSGSEDSTICIWRVYDWQCLHILGGHKSGINSIAVHPSGKLALSASKDNTLKTWNLIHGRCAFTRRLRGPADKVLWHHLGEHYLLVIGNELQVYNVEDNKVCAVSFSFTSRINQAVFTNPGKNVGLHAICIAAICDDKSLHILDLSGKKISADLTSLLDGGRARDLWSCPADLSVGGEEMQEILEDEGDSLAIVTSNGLLTVLSCHALAEKATESTDVSEAVQSSTQITAQPRLTAVVSWVQKRHPTSSSSSSAVITSTSSAATGQVSEKTKNKNKNKKRKAEEEKGEGEKKSKVRFADDSGNSSSSISSSSGGGVIGSSGKKKGGKK